jgi:ABC-type lipoprotein release transport system permease subunit
MKLHRAILIILMLLGLAVGYCGGLEQAPLGRSVYLAGELCMVELKEPAASQVEEVHETLQVCFNMSTVSMYLGVAVAIAAIAGLSIPNKQAPTNDPSSSL